MTPAHPTKTTAPRTRELSKPNGYLFWDSLRFLRMGKFDPTTHLERDRFIMARWYRSGPACVEVHAHQACFKASAWGLGAEEALDTVDALLGLHDEPLADFGDAQLNRRLRPVLNLRLVRAPSLAHVLVNVVIQQQIAWRDAARIWRSLCRTHGDLAPGPHDLRLPLSFECLRSLPRQAFERAGLSARRGVLLREIARLGFRIDDWYAESTETYVTRIMTLPQMGPWTTHFPLAIGMGEPDTLILGDYALPHTVSWALRGQARSTDAEMVRLLEPFRGNRWRLVRLLWALNIQAPRRGPRLSTPHTRR